MNIFTRIAQWFSRNSHERHDSPVLDHVRNTGASGDWRKRKLAEAAEKYGRPFKCAGDDLPHEVVMSDHRITNGRGPRA